MTTQDFIALFQEAFGKKVQLPLLFGYSDKPIASTEKIGGCFTIPMSRFKSMMETMKECFLFDSHAWKKVKARLEE